MAVGAQCICLVCRRTSPMRPYNNNASNNCNIFTSHPASAHTYNFLRCIKFFTSCPGGGYVIIIERSAAAAVAASGEKEKRWDMRVPCVSVCGEHTTLAVKWTRDRPQRVALVCPRHRHADFRPRPQNGYIKTVQLHFHQVNPEGSLDFIILPQESTYWKTFPPAYMYI
jgi:hypothetical protein